MSNEKMIEILKKEYGISSVRDLDDAIAKLPKIDLTPFTGAVIKIKEKTA